MKYFVCTGNSGKLEEFKAALSLNSGNEFFGIRDVFDFGASKYTEPEEPYDIFLANGLTKLKSAQHYIHNNRELLVKNAAFPDCILVDDSGLCVSHLGDKPGVHSATYGGLPRDDAKNRLALREAMGESDAFEVRKEAYFICFLFELKMRSCKPDGPLLDELLPEFLKKERELLSAIKKQRPEKQGYKKIEYPEFGLSIHVGFCFGEVSTREQQLIPGAGHGYDSMFYPDANSELSFASIDLMTKNSLSHRAQALKSLAV